ASDIRWEEIRRALESLEGAADAAGERPGEHCLGDAGHVFEQDVPFAEVSGDGQRQLGPLADDDFLDVAHDAAGNCRNVDLALTHGAWARPRRNAIRIRERRRPPSIVS